MLPPEPFWDAYQLPEYALGFVEFLTEAQRFLVQESSPLIKHIFAGKTPYVVPDGIAKSVASAVANNGRIIHATANNEVSEFTLTPEHVLNGQYLLFTDDIVLNLFDAVERIHARLSVSMQDQGALVKLDRSKNFWDQYIDWIEERNIPFAEDGTPMTSHLTALGNGDVSWAAQVEPTAEQTERLRDVIDAKRAKFLARKSAQRNLPPAEKKLITSSQLQDVVERVRQNEKFLCEYALPEYEKGQIGWVRGFMSFELRKSPALRAYYADYEALKLRQASSTGTPGGTTAAIPPRQIAIKEIMSYEDVIGGHYNRRYASIRSQVDEMRPSLVAEALDAMKLLQAARGVDTIAVAIEDFDWDQYLDNLERLDIAFDKDGDPVVPQLAGNVQPGDMSQAQMDRLNSILERKWNEENARRSRSRRLFE